MTLPTHPPAAAAPRRHRRHASTLMVTMAITALLGLALTTYLTMVNNQNRLVVRSQTWNACMPILEAGIEEALTHCQYNYLTNMVSNGWELFNGTYVKSNQIGAGYYLTAISQAVPYEIVSRGYLRMPGTDAAITRTVKVQTAPQSVFSGAMIMRNTINLNGNNIRSDSYDSEDSSKSTNGKYDPAKAQDNGDIGSIGGLIDSVSIGNADIWGHVMTGPNGKVRVGANGSVGSKDWHAAGNKGIQPGWWLNDMNMSFPDVQTPTGAATPPLPGTVGATSYDYVLGDGDYIVPTLSGKVLVEGEAVLYVPGNVNFSSGDILEIAPGAKLTLYVGGASTTINTVVNNSDLAGSFTYFGLPSNTAVTISGNAALAAAMYAPNAKIVMNGGINYFGSVIGSDATLNGHSSFHYDEALGRIPPSRAVIVTSWNEI